jgi:hypothetical protein
MSGDKIGVTKMICLTWLIQIQHMSVDDLENIATEIAKIAYDIQTSVIRHYDPKFAGNGLKIIV